TLPKIRKYNFKAVVNGKVDPASPGYTAVTTSTAYTDARGYGWLSTKGITAVATADPDPLLADFHRSTTQATFQVQVTPGDKYTINVYLYDYVMYHFNMTVTIK